jgi:hypothetical protein
MVATAKRLLEVLVSEAKSCRRDSPAPFQTTQNTDNLDNPSQSLQYLAESAKSLYDILQRGFTMGIKMARFNLTKNLGRLQSNIGESGNGSKWDEGHKYARQC